MMQLIIITLITLVASCVGLVSGFGLGTIMAPTLLFFLPFSQVILLVCIIHWFHNIWKLLFFHHGINWQLFLSFGIPSIIAGIFGALLVGDKGFMLTSLLGVFLIAYVFVLWFMPTLHFKHTWLNGFIGGTLTGFFAGIFGIRGALRSMFLSAFNLSKATYLGTIGAISFLLDSTRLIVYFSHGIKLEQSLTNGLLFFIPASFIGAWIGKYAVHKIPQEHFRKIIAIFLLCAGIRLLLMPWF